MHEPVVGYLEEYLAGVTLPVVEEHLKNCPSCREELTRMQMHSDLLQALRPEREVEPAPGFYARVMNRVEAQGKPSIWNLFGESLFAKRLAYASATFLVLMGTYFVSSNAQEDSLASAPEAMMLDNDHDHVGHDAEKNRESILVTLATYQE